MQKLAHDKPYAHRRRRLTYSCFCTDKVDFNRLMATASAKLLHMGF